MGPMKSPYMSVAPLRPVSRTYTYRVPDGDQVAVGQVVRIPFGKKSDTDPTLGVVWAAADTPDIDPAKIKQLEPLSGFPLLSDNLRRFLQWSADYTVSPLGLYLRMALPISDVTRPTPRITRLKLAHDAKPDTGSDARRKVVDLLGSGAALTRTEIRAAIHVSDGVIKKMIDDGTLVAIEQNIDEAPEKIMRYSDIALPDYNDGQRVAADMLVERVRAAEFSVTLLDGVTGSGKTEVYFAAIKHALEAGKQILVLMPEIALTAQFIERFAARFGHVPVTWHSHLTPAQRRRNLKAIVHGHAQVVLAARSGLFLPYPSLGLVVVDEEHDTSYKQEEGVFYNARDLAIKRAQIEKTPIILVSATPSLETFHNAQSGKYHWVRLPARFNAAQLPDINIIDMRAQKMKRTEFLSPPLLAAMKDTLDKGEQVMLYLNRRGYAPLTLCRACGHRVECPRCTAWLVQHRIHGGLICHHCGWHAAPPKKCVSCGADDSLAACGPGVERIEDEVKKFFPDKKIAVLSSDTQRSVSVLADTLHRIENREIDIIIGTQIVAKGHHFPLLTLVGIVDADLGLGGGDLRAGERTFQVLHQVAGRAGRGAHPGHVMVQSFMPDHRVIQTLQKNDRDAFLEVEGAERIAAHMPPAGRLAALIISSKYDDKAKRHADALARHAPNADGFRVLGPAPAPIFKIRNQYRYRLLLKCGAGLNIQKYVADWVAATPEVTGVRVQIDIDPYSFM